MVAEADLAREERRHRDLAGSSGERQEFHWESHLCHKGYAVRPQVTMHKGKLEDLRSDNSA